MSKHEVLSPAVAGEAVAAAEDRSMFDKLRNTRVIQALAVGGAALAIAGGEAINADKAEASAPVTSEITTDQLIVKKGKSSVRANSFSAVNLMTNHRTVSKALIKDAKQEGDCRWINGKKEEIWVEGLGPNGVGFGRDTRKSLFCVVDKDVNGDGKANKEDIVRAVCGNVATVEQPEEEVENALWTDSRTRGRIRVVSRSSAVAKATCETNGTYAYAEGRGFAVAKGFLKVKSAVRSKGKNISKVIQRVSMRAKGWAKSKAAARAEVVCIEQGGVPVPPEQHKNGELTPQPPANAPGPNPTPSPEEPYSGGYECYSETTGAPVEPRDDGTCPAGSVGSF